MKRGSKAAPAHAVVAGAEASRRPRCVICGTRGVGHRLDHLRAVLDDAAALGLAARPCSRWCSAGRRCGVPGWQQSWMNCAALAAPSGVIGPLLPMRPHGWPSIAAWPHTVCCAVERLELEEVGAVDHARDDLAHVVGLAVVGGHDAAAARRCRSAAPERPAPGAAAACRSSASLPITSRAMRDAVGVVLGHVLGGARRRWRASRRRPAPRRWRSRRWRPSAAAGRPGRPWPGRAPR